MSSRLRWGALCLASWTKQSERFEFFFFYKEHLHLNFEITTQSFSFFSLLYHSYLKAQSNMGCLLCSPCE